MPHKPTSKNDYDRILKENLILEFLDVFKEILGIADCQVDADIKIPQGKIHRTTEREPDYSAVMKRQNGTKFILHLEFQSQDDQEMVYRNQEYHALLQRAVHLPIRHIVLYTGTKRPKMQNQLAPDMIYSGFDLVNLSEFDSVEMINSASPQEVIMAILGDFAGVHQEEMIQKILQRLQSMSDNETKLKKYIYQLTILARLRNLQSETIKQSETMALTIDIDNDILYKRGIEKGFDLGKDQGIDLGIDLGIERTNRQTIVNMLMDSSMTVEMIANFTNTSVEYVLQIKKELEK